MKRNPILPTIALTLLLLTSCATPGEPFGSPGGVGTDLTVSGTPSVEPSAESSPSATPTTMSSVPTPNLEYTSDTPSNPYHASFEEWASFRDWSGKLLDYESADISLIELRYVLGWTLDDPEPKKIYQGDTIGGLEVADAYSQYYVNYSTWGDPPYLFPIYNTRYHFDTQNGEIILSGLVVRGTETLEDGRDISMPYTRFYPYNNENGSNFPIVMPPNEWYGYDYFKALSLIRVSNDTLIEVQPIGAAVDDVLFPQNGEIFDVMLKLSSFEISLWGQSLDSPPIGPSAWASVLEVLHCETLK